MYNIKLLVYNKEYNGKNYRNCVLVADLGYCKKTIAFKKSDVCEYLNIPFSALEKYSLGEHTVGSLNIKSNIN